MIRVVALQADLLQSVTDFIFIHLTIKLEQISCSCWRKACFMFHHRDDLFRTKQILFLSHKEFRTIEKFVFFGLIWPEHLFPHVYYVFCKACRIPLAGIHLVFFQQWLITVLSTESSSCAVNLCPFSRFTLTLLAVLNNSHH